MEKKTPKRKLIGFMAGEKGSIGKLQALGLGIAGMISSGLLIPHFAESYGDANHIDNGHTDTWPDYSWTDDAHDDDTGHGYNSYVDWTDEGSHEDGYQDTYCDSHDDYSDHTDHSDYSDYSDWGDWSGDWSGDWVNAPPSVSIEVK